MKTILRAVVRFMDYVDGLGSKSNYEKRLYNVSLGDTDSYFAMVLKSRIAEMEGYEYKGGETHKKNYIKKVLTRIENRVIELGVDTRTLSNDEVHDIIDWRY